MSQVRVHNFSVSLDGFGTGEGQSLVAPFGDAGTRLHEWFFPTRTFRAMQGQPGGSTGIDDAFASAWAPGIGAEVMGRGKFGPHHGPWPDQEWNGWWGDTPPFHTPVFVLTHHPRPSVEMHGGTTFHFIDADPAQALAQARQAAAGGDVRIGGGPSTIREFLAARPDRLPAHRRCADRAGPRGAALGRSGGARRPLPDRGRKQPQRRHPRLPQPPVTAGARRGRASAKAVQHLMTFAASPSE